MALPIMQSDSQEMLQMQTRWATELNPLIRNVANNGILLQSVALVAGANVVNHKLGRKLQGWMLSRVRAAATVYDTQDTNQMPELTLTLQASVPVIVDIYVF